MFIPMNYSLGNFPKRNLFSFFTSPARTSTGWIKVNFATTAYDEDGTAIMTLLDPKFGHFNSDGDIVLDCGIPVYFSGIAYPAKTSSGTTVYSGLRILRNDSELISIMGSSSTTQPSFRRNFWHLNKGDIIKVQTKVTSTTTSYNKVAMTISWWGA